MRLSAEPRPGKDRVPAMSPFDVSGGQASHVGFAPASGAPDVKWIHSGAPAYRPPATSTSTAAERSERVNAMIVIALTLACTVLAIYDLFLLAAGA